MHLILKPRTYRLLILMENAIWPLRVVKNTCFWRAWFAPPCQGCLSPFLLFQHPSCSEIVTNKPLWLMGVCGFSRYAEARKYKKSTSIYNMICRYTFRVFKSMEAIWLKQTLKKMTMAEGAMSKKENLEAEGDALDALGCQPNIHPLHLHCWQSPSFIHFPSMPHRIRGGTSLVVQQIRICLPTQRTLLWSLVWEDFTCCRAT